MVVALRESERQSPEQADGGFHQMGAGRRTEIRRAARVRTAARRSREDGACSLGQSQGELVTNGANESTQRGIGHLTSCALIHASTTVRVCRRAGVPPSRLRRFGELGRSSIANQTSGGQ